MKTRYLCSLLGLLLVFSACTGEERTGHQHPGTEKEVRITASIPGHFLPATRSMGGEKENEMKTVDVLVFDASHNFVEHKPGTDIIQAGTNNGDVSFKVALSSGANRNIVVVANARNLINSLSPGWSGTSGQAAILAQLDYTNTSVWAANGVEPAGYTPIPMIGQLPDKTITSGGTLSGLELTRMLARIDVKSSTPDFVLQKIYLCNYNTKGYIAPAWDINGTMQATITSPNLPDDPGKQSGSWFAYTPSSQLFEGRIYTFESSAAADTSGIDHTDRKDATCLVVEGEYKGEINFYRIDFTEEQTEGTDPTGIPYMPLLRNHKYVVNIQAADGTGYRTVTAALDSYTIPSNLKTRLICYDQSKVKDIVYNGQYMLGVSASQFEFTRDAFDKRSTGNEISIMTDSPGGWSVESYTDGLGNSIDWLSLLSSSGNSGETVDTRLTLSPNTTGSARTGYINLKADRLACRIEVTQIHTLNLDVIITDINGNAISTLEFAADAGMQPDLQNFNVEWAPRGGTVNITNTQTASANATFIFDGTYDEITNGSTLSNIEGGKTYTIRPSAISQSELDADLFWERSSDVVFSINDGAEQVSKTLTLRQLVYNLTVPYLGEVYYTDGTTYQIYVLCNTDWQIKSVTETLTAGSGSFVASGDLIAGRSGVSNLPYGTLLSFTTTNNAHAMGKLTVVFESPDGKFDDVSIVLNMNNEYYPMPHKGWAGSNIYAVWDGITSSYKLTFDDVGDTTHENYQGLFFHWGSLWGIDASGHYVGSNSNWNNNHRVYKPDGSIATSIDWNSIPSVLAVNISRLSNYHDRHYLLEVHDPDNGTGDICKYITDQGWAPGTNTGKKWRMPTSKEFGATSDYTRSGTWTGVTVPTEDSNREGKYVNNNAPGYNMNAVGTPFFPPSGWRFSDNGNLQSVGDYAFYWSGSSVVTNGTFMHCNNMGVNPVGDTSRTSGFSVRCVQE